MLEEGLLSPAEQASQEALESIYYCTDHGKSFLLEAGAGAGKTYSLVKALKYLIQKRGNELLRRQQRIACITYTNVARDEIEARTDGHPVVFSSTIHAFCWSTIKDFQPFLRDKISCLNERWTKKIEEAGGVGIRKIDYELGYPTVKEDRVFLGHDDVLSLTILLMGEPKFRSIFSMRYPIIFIDEYQDTDKKFADALITHFLGKNKSPLIGFFGDHWQKIYGGGCGKIEHEALEIIGKKANFRSVKTIVEGLNRMRPDLPQELTDSDAEGFLAVYHTNSFKGERREGGHWKGDLPADVAHRELEFIREYLICEGWDFSADKTKILMLTHNGLAEEQGYSNLARVFSGNEAYIKKEDPYISFFVDTLEPACAAYIDKRFGDMFAILGSHTPAIQNHAQKKSWASDMDKLIELRETANIGTVLDHLMHTKRPRLPSKIERKERDLQCLSSEQVKLREVLYREVIALSQFLNEHTPFATKHGVKGAEFNNVLVVLGRGWNQYNFNQMLEWAETGVPSDKQETFERNRNLFYVVCSRPKKRLALLFTQELSPDAMTTLAKWFGASVIYPI